MSAMVTQTATPLESVPGLGEGLVEKLGAAGITTVEALADMTPEQLEAIEGIGPKTVEKISLAVNNYFASLEQGATLEGAAEAAVAESSEAGGEDITAEIAVAGEEVASAEEVASGEESAPGEEAAAAPADENDGQAKHSVEQSALEESRASETTE